MALGRMVVLAAAVVATVAASGLAAAAEYDRFLAGGWTGGAHRSDDTGEFTHCAISMTYPKGIVVVYGLSRDGELDLFLGSEAWHLKKGGQSDATLSIDGARIGQFPAAPISENLLKISLGSGNDALEALRRGKSLTVTGLQRKFVLRLVGTGQALPRLQRCVESAMAAAGPGRANSFERKDEARNPFKPDQGRTPRAYTRNEVADILARAGLRDPEFFSDEEMKQYPGFGHMWTYDGKIGFVSQFLRDPDATVDELAARFMARLTNDCRGEVASGAKPATIQGAFVFKESFVSCSGEKHDFHAYAVAVFEPARVSVFGYMGWGAEGRASAARETAKLGAALRQVYF
jgi:hypothetical protein